MTLDTFFEKFELLADTPNAVARMRELILSLAMQGKLVEQDTADQPAKELLNEVIKERMAAKEGELTKLPKPLAPISTEEIPFELPSGWVWERLGNIGYTNIGLTYSPNDISDTGIPVLRSSNIQNGKIDLSDLVRVAVEPKNSVLVEISDLIICARNGSRALVGKTAIIDSLEEKTAFGAFMAIFRSRFNQFLYHFFSSPLFRNVIGEVNTTTINQITQGNLRNTLAPLPPLAEQKRIVAKVDELMALCDRLEALQQDRDRRQALLARAALSRFAEAPTLWNLGNLFHPAFSIAPGDLRKAILTLAVRGKLVAQDSSENPADQLLAEIATNSNGKVTRRARASVDLEVLPEMNLPNGWAWAKFPELGEFGRGKSKHRPRNDASLYIDGKYPLVQTGDVARSGGSIQTYTGLYNENGLAQSKMWPKGTMCITIAANIADSGVLDFDACFPDSIVGFIPHHKIPSVRYFEYFLRTAKENLEKFAPATAQKNINLGILEQVWIPIPPLAEQRRIVAKVDQLMALVDALEQQLAASRSTAANLLSALVAEIPSQKGGSDET